MKLIDRLQQLHPDSSKTSLKQWILHGRIESDNKILKYPDAEVAENQELILLARKKYADHGIEILYEDKELVVIEKPEGLLTVATDYEKLCVHSILKRRFYKATVFPVHRLDRETSGVLVFAYTQRAREFLKKKFEAHDLERHYEAVVQGIPCHQTGVWKSLLVEDERYFVKSGKDGKLAISHYKTIESKKNFSRLAIRLETGRKNQIRAQASEAGHPIVGDLKYGYLGPAVSRLYLHARTLAFAHPLTGKILSFTSKYQLNF